MKARLKPLDGKYYGTIVQIIEGPLAYGEINVWLASGDWENGSMEPSDRELVSCDISRDEHNRLYHSSDSDSTPVDISGGHYENRNSYRVASAIVDALRQLGEKS